MNTRHSSEQSRRDKLLSGTQRMKTYVISAQAKGLEGVSFCRAKTEDEGGILTKQEHSSPFVKRTFTQHSEKRRRKRNKRKGRTHNVIG